MSNDQLVRIERLDGEIDIAAVPELMRRFTALPNTLHGLIVDLTDVSYMDSSGIRLLHELHNRLQLRAQQLVIVSPPATAPRRVLDLTAFSERVALHDSLAAARAGWTAGSSLP